VFPAWYPQGANPTPEQRRPIALVLLQTPLSAVAFGLLNVCSGDWIVSESRTKFHVVKRHCFEESANSIWRLFVYELVGF
jgi:hypothetical protein